MEDYADDSTRRLRHANNVEIQREPPNAPNPASQHDYFMRSELEWQEYLSSPQRTSPLGACNCGGTVNPNCLASHESEPDVFPNATGNLASGQTAVPESTTRNLNTLVDEHSSGNLNGPKRNIPGTPILSGWGLESTRSSDGPTSGYPTEETQLTSHSGQCSALFSYGGDCDCNGGLVNISASRPPDFLQQPNPTGTDQPFAQGFIHGNSSHGLESDITGINPVPEYSFPIPQDISGDLFSPDYTTDTPEAHPTPSSGQPAGVVDNDWTRLNRNIPLLGQPIGATHDNWGEFTTDAPGAFQTAPLGPGTRPSNDARVAPDANTPDIQQTISSGHVGHRWTPAFQPPHDNDPPPGACIPVAPCSSRSGGSGTRKLCPGNADGKGKGRSGKKRKGTKMHICPECEGSFTKKQDLKRHLQTKNPPGWWGTLYCDYMRARRDKVKQHVTNVHPDKDPNDLVKNKSGSQIFRIPCNLGCRCIYTTWDEWFDHLYKDHSGIILREISPSEGESGAGSSQSSVPMDSPNGTQDNLGATTDRTPRLRRIVERVWPGKRRDSASPPTENRPFYRRRTP